MAQKSAPNRLGSLRNWARQNGGRCYATEEEGMRQALSQAGRERGRPAAPLPAPLPTAAPPTTGRERCRFRLPELPLTFRSSGKAKPEAAAVSGTVRFFIHLRPEEEAGEGEEGIFGKAWHARTHAAPPPAHVTREGGGGGTMLLLLRQNK